MLLVHIRTQGFTNLPPMGSRRYRERLSKAAYLVIHTETKRRVMEKRRAREKREREKDNVNGGRLGKRAKITKCINFRRRNELKIISP